MLCLLMGCGDLGKRFPANIDLTSENEQSIAQVASLLETYVDQDGNIDYSSWRKNTENLGKLRKAFFAIASISTDNYTPEQKKVFFINAHNLLVIWLVLWKYASTSSGSNLSNQRSIQNLAKPGQSPFISFQWRVAREVMTLNEIREKVLIPMGDPRIHFALTLASKSMPLLHKKLFDTKDLDKTLDEITRKYSNLPTTTTVDEERKLIQTSALFSWYRSDFEKNLGTLNEFFLKYLEPGKYNSELIKKADTSFKDFDWALNEFNGQTTQPPPEEPDNDFWSWIQKIVQFIKCEIFGFLKLCEKTKVDPLLLEGLENYEN